MRHTSSGQLRPAVKCGGGFDRSVNSCSSRPHCVGLLKIVIGDGSEAESEACAQDPVNKPAYPSVSLFNRKALELVWGVSWLR